MPSISFSTDQNLYQINICLLKKERNMCTMHKYKYGIHSDTQYWLAFWNEFISLLNTIPTIKFTSNKKINLILTILLQIYYYYEK